MGETMKAQSEGERLLSLTATLYHFIRFMYHEFHSFRSTCIILKISGLVVTPKVACLRNELSKFIVETLC